MEFQDPNANVQEHDHENGQEHEHLGHELENRHGHVQHGLEDNCRVHYCAAQSLQNYDSYLGSFPPGYRFKPFDHELVNFYLAPKLDKKPLPPNRINDVELYRHNPDDLAERYRPEGKEWYFFTPRMRKYKGGDRPKRKAGDGYWKATGSDKTVTSNGDEVGYKKSLVFYKGNPPKGVKTDWIMHEFRANRPRMPRKNMNDMQLDEWVLCKIYKKSSKKKEESGQDHTDELAKTPSTKAPKGKPKPKKCRVHKSNRSDTEQNHVHVDIQTEAGTGQNLSSETTFPSFDIPPPFSDCNYLYVEPTVCDQISQSFPFSPRESYYFSPLENIDNSFSLADHQGDGDGDWMLDFVRKC